MKKIIIWAVAIIILLVLVISITQNKDNSAVASTSDSQLVAQSDSFDFGDIDIFGGKVSTDYIIENRGTQDVAITSAYTSCMCTEGEINGYKFGMHGSSGEEAIIPAGGQETLTAIFDPLAHGPEGTGPITRELILETNSTASPELTIHFRGNVVKN
ncbi:MAG: hypothetical protein COU09_02760 [Candidatus Harrisonbacteria bacterium CG10_big_fil_rev_8_21_14_0_10_44_23]|uniref:DUF1573 domain-containing protein n=1 Tax=Candidatus Harrisonbacteria bacterium CG10_big_fil_rev_8_21_14_0_10_44_23 TaxID=1974585 RepID=A0A2H0UPI2_9BACT|nr:MAG: hypothetical protein COU09_02760 [Candidatus Harrisonbacteria bacterium CG10_big_fil_rev_8_21_14_0_10_44_23]